MADSKSKGIYLVPPGSIMSIETRVSLAALTFWEDCNAKSTDSMAQLSAINADLRELNDLLAPLGGLDAALSGKTTKEDLKKFLDAKPELMYQINGAMKRAGLTLFEKTDPGSPAFAYRNFGISEYDQNMGVQDAARPADLIAHERRWAVRTLMTAVPSGAPGGTTPVWNEWYRAAAALVLNRKVSDMPSDPRRLSDTDWQTIGDSLCLINVPESSKMQRYRKTLAEFDFSGEAFFGLGSVNKRFDLKGITYNQMQYVIEDMTNKAIEGFEWEMDRRVFGGLNKTFAPADVIRALGEVKAMVSKLSNDLQAKTIDVNTDLQRTMAALNMFLDPFKKYMDAMASIRF